ncbi:MAG: alpha/beta fold hydrolase [Rhizobiaceae bacterium]
MTTSHNSFGSGPAVIFLHGVGSGKEGWQHQVLPVVEIGWQFVAIDAPGFGANPVPDDVGFEPHVGGVLEVMDHLGLEKAVICGHSLGGMTAQEVFASAADRVSGLILSATSPAFGRPDGDFQKKFLRDRFAPFDNGMSMAEFAERFSPKLVGPAPQPNAVQEIVDVMKLVPIDTYRQAMRTITGFDQRDNLPNINVPTLLIAGENDTNAPAPMMEKMAGKIADAQFVLLPQTGHLAPIENPEIFNQHLTDFLKRIDPT